MCFVSTTSVVCLSPAMGNLSGLLNDPMCFERWFSKASSAKHQNQALLSPRQREVLIIATIDCRLSDARRD